MSVTERVGGTVVVGESAEWYRRLRTLFTAISRASEAITAVRKLCAPACLRSRISRRRVGSVKVGLALVTSLKSGFEGSLEDGRAGVGVGVGFEEDTGSIKTKGGTGVVAGSSVIVATKNQIIKMYIPLWDQEGSKTAYIGEDRTCNDAENPGADRRRREHSKAKLCIVSNFNFQLSRIKDLEMGNGLASSM